MPVAVRSVPASDDPAETVGSFDDRLSANRTYAKTAPVKGFDGVAHAGVAMVTCMDSRIDPLRMVGLRPGDAKIFRNPGGRVDDAAAAGLRPGRAGDGARAR